MFFFNKKVSFLLILSLTAFFVSLFSNFPIRNQLLCVSSVITIVVILKDIKGLLNLDIENDTGFIKGKLLLNLWIIYFMLSFILSNSLSSLSASSFYNFELNLNIWFYLVSIFCLACIIYLIKDSSFGKKINNFTGWYFYCLALVAIFVFLFFISALMVFDINFFNNSCAPFLTGVFLLIIISIIISIKSFIAGLKKNKTSSYRCGIILNTILLFLFIGSCFAFVLFSNSIHNTQNFFQKNEFDDTEKIMFHSRFGYSIEYPALWVLYRFPIPAKGHFDNPVIHLENADGDKYFYEIIYLLDKKTDFCDVDYSDSQCLPGSLDTSFELRVEENGNNLTLEEIVNEEIKPFINDLHLENVTVGDQKAIKYWIDCVSNGGIGCNVFHWKIIHGKYIYSIDYNIAGRDKYIKYDKIVQSIKFNSGAGFENNR